MNSVDDYRSKILPLRATAEIWDARLRERLDTVLPAIMKREGIDLWIVMAREYNEDPVLLSLLPVTAMTARRRTILVFAVDADGTVDRLALDRYGYGDLYRAAWHPEREDQLECLARVIRERDPQAIGIDWSETFSFGDGLSHTEYLRLAGALGEGFMARTRSAERLVLGWLECRTAAELEAYPSMVEMGHALIAEAFSGQTIHPGVTTTDDVVWWLRQEMLDLGVQAWFQPTVAIQAGGQGFPSPSGSRRAKSGRKQILPGDLLHCDVGFYYLGLATDQQQHAYVLRAGESDAPAGLKAALAAGNRLQDILAETMIPGRTGNEVLRTALRRARREGLHPFIYSHPIGYHGHAAGPTIGLWDHQEGVPGAGDYPLYDETCYAIELAVREPVPEWDGRRVRIALEEDAALTGGRFIWLAGRQTRFHLIG